MGTINTVHHRNTPPPPPLPPSPPLLLSICYMDASQRTQLKRRRGKYIDLEGHTEEAKSSSSRSKIETAMWFRAGNGHVLHFQQYALLRRSNNDLICGSGDSVLLVARSIFQPILSVSRLSISSMTIEHTVVVTLVLTRALPMLRFDHR